MSSKDIVIKVENLSKCYRIWGKENIRDSFFSAILDFVKTPLSNYRKYRSLYKFDDIDPSSNVNSNPSDIIWALRDISLEVKRGDLVGIIGRNGAGKSTLLKVLSKITHPTRGRAVVTGRVSSLIEVGTGFHPELTGRENVYLNGTILGMTKKEVDRKFDEIVEFSGVEKFIETPVKRYSSGMTVRLAFSVAAHLEPEILIIDEVLAVGDVAFQKKCLGKMDSVTRKGRTVLFVSHNMPAITRLCKRAILLDGGRIIEDGPSHKVVSEYLTFGTGTRASQEWPDLKTAPGDEVARLHSVRVRTKGGKTIDVAETSQTFGIEMQYEVFKKGYFLVPNFELFNEEGVSMFTTLEQSPRWRDLPWRIGSYLSTVWIPGNLLAEGKLFISCYITSASPFTQHCMIPDALVVQVVDPPEGDSARGDWTGPVDGILRPLLEWDTRFIGNEMSISSKRY